MKLFSDHPLDEVRITGGFGDPYPGGYQHRGVDYGCPEGTPVYYQGYDRARIHTAENTGSFGLHVRLELPNLDEATGRLLWVVYGHLSALGHMVGAGDYLVPGQALGFSGNTGLSSGPHLHWQIYIDGPGASTDIAKSRNPLPMIGDEKMADPTNSILVMERDLRRLINGKHPSVPKLHKFLRFAYQDDAGFEYDGDYSEVGL